MKYYLCIKDVPSSDNRDITAFIAFAFSKNPNHIDKLLGNRFDFGKGYIYHTSHYDDRYIIDGNKRSHKLLGLEGYFEEFKLEIEEEAQKIIDKKKNDLIEIEPLYKNENGVPVYSIDCSCQGKNECKRETAISTSQVDGIIECYKKIRRRTNQALNWKAILHRHVRRFTYGKK